MKTFIVKLWAATLLSYLFVATAVQAQNQHQNNESCLYQQAVTPSSKAFEGALQQYFRSRTNDTRRVTKQQKAAGNPRYVIPVVFHIYGTEWKGNSGQVYPVNDAIVKEALEAVNANFKGGNDPVNPRFQSIEGRMDVEFRLAQIDPKGNTTTGIIYHEYQEGFALNGTRDKDIARYAWDNFKYMNVHIQLILKSGSTTNSGTAWLPATGMSEEGTARVVYNGKYLLYTPPASSLTHEFGHFLGLYHTFRGGCTRGEGDKVSDTPATTGGEAPRDCQVNTSLQNCFNEFINVQNHMDYNPCEAMFTQGQVTRMEGFLDLHEARKTLWTNNNLIATGTVTTPANRRVVFTYQQITDSDQDKYLSLVEHFDNDGKILNKRKIKAEGVQFARLGALRQGVHYAVSGVPTGLTVNINVIDQTMAEISLAGKANQHNKANSTDFTVTLLNPAIIGGVGQLTHTTGTYTIDFLEAYGRYYEVFSKHLEMGYTTPNRLPQNSSFESFAIGGKFSVLLRNFDGDQVTLDNYETNLEVLCNANTKQVRMLSENATISANSAGTWQSRAGVTDQLPIITSPGYTTWRGKTAYAAIRIPTINNSYLYGWLLLEVSADGSHVKGIAYGLREKPGASMTTTITKPMVVYYNDRFVEAKTNDGTMANDILVELKNASFANRGVLTSGTHYTIKNVPAGLIFEVNVLDSKHARLKMKGRSTYQGHSANQGWDYLNNIDLEFLTAAFASGNAATIIASKYTLNMEFLGQSFIKTLENEVMDLNQGSPNSASFSLLTSHQSLSRAQVTYQLQLYKTGQSSVPGLKFISWRKDAIANANYELTPLGYGIKIGPGSSWKKGRQYHLGRGQHLIDSDVYRAWRGKRQYIGIRFQRSGRMHYGWIEMKVSSDGKVLQFLSCAVSAIPDQSIVAGTLLSADDKVYCTAKGNNGPEAITKVQLGTINNSSNRDAVGYHNYRHISTTVARNGSHNLRVEIIGYRDGSDDEIYAWVDWNQDGDFDDSGETITMNKTGNLVAVATVTVPANAVLGSTSMRIKVSYRSTTACGSFSYGEVEDYTLNVAPRATANTRVANRAQGNDLTVFAYPNPVKKGGTLCLKINPNTTQKGVVNVKVIDLLGNIINSGDSKEEKHEKLIKINTANYKAGIYILRTTLGETVHTMRFVVK
ncbi:M43 family zinc metalloprotease [uncultured Microscilla sp.]|uniref:M43 family zinc metalloprotease n=1 Tax=uncultured Microscilla sp. TaxID=432653 RepID=UPI00262396F7|nr:M43 family zinc metalloprotease [uncultured Microscilla sp.]